MSLVPLFVGTIGRSLRRWPWSCLGLEAYDLGLGLAKNGLVYITVYNFYDGALVAVW